MNFYREAAAALRQNTRSVALFLAVGAIWGGADSVFRLFILKPAADGSTQLIGLGIVGWQIVSVAIMSAANSVILARIGREIDKPMWRVADDRDALTLFFKLWFLLELLPLVYVHGMGALLPLNPDFPTAMLFLTIAFTIATLVKVIGASIMFYGKVAKQEVQEAFTTISRHAGPILAICLVGVLAGTVLSTFHEFSTAPQTSANDTNWYQSAQAVAVSGILAGVDALVGCFIFAYAWLVCIFHRDHYEQPGDDFDF